MAEQDIGQAFNNLAFQLQGLSNKLGAQGVNQIIPKFAGDATKFRTWIKQIEKYIVLAGLGRNEAKMVAYQASDPPVSDFIHRWLEQNDGDETVGWNELKAQLVVRFSEVSDPQHAFDLLSKIKQKHGENVPIFAERLYNLAEEVFKDQNVNLPIIQKQLVNFFINGLSLDYLKMKIMRSNPDTFQGAVAVAMTEQNLRKRFELRRGTPERSNQSRHYEVQGASEEAMEVDHFRNSKRCFNCNKVGHRSRDCRARKQVNAFDQTPKFNKDIECWKCGRKGHIKRFCRVRTFEKQENRFQGN
ncbi:Hypothetical predicted protein [Mytilus galloprovincialis]|uniref:CCHC-type domain-containing protein n=1 Tax=Mytilus galloprovincialis TaxID=29158 RepID=A0A8B6E0V6_MYTGA|nr:Hypothetical predicted protein [Mytilus galloprovincialis]